MMAVNINMSAADINISHILQELVQSPCNPNQQCSNDEDKNNNINNTEIAEEPWLLTRKMTQEQEHTHEQRCEVSFKTQCKENEPKDPQRDQCYSQVPDQATPKPNIPTKGSVFEKWAVMDKANQRPLAKRQLSDFSKALTSSAVKKTVVQQEYQTRQKVQSSAAQQDRTPDQIALKQHGSRRKLQKELISNTEDFDKVDTHVISAGQEVRNICHLI